jgi:hypothetical protein
MGHVRAVTGVPTPAIAVVIPVLADSTLALLAPEANLVLRETAVRIREASSCGVPKYWTSALKKQPDFRWFPPSLSSGDVGLALACGHLDKCFPDNGWDVIARNYMTAALDNVSQKTLGPSLFSGLAGIGFVAEFLSRGGTRYGRLLTTIDDALTNPTINLCESLSKSYGCPVADIDLVSGAAGISLYLINRQESSRSKHLLLRLLTALSGISVRQANYPAWHTPFDQQTKATQFHCPGGSLNCGLAHGISGVLAALSIAQSSGVILDSLPAAIHANARWIINNASADEWGPNWPTVIPLADTSQSRTRPQSRAAWCYGVPGIARALWLAGRALGETRYCEYAVDAWTALAARPRSQWRLHSVTFCHGSAGILQIALRFAQEIPNIVNTQLILQLLNEILLAYRPDTAFCFSDKLADGSQVQRPGVLEGAAGVLLTLLTVTTSSDPTWDRAFGIS